MIDVPFVGNHMKPTTIWFSAAILIAKSGVRGSYEVSSLDPELLDMIRIGLSGYFSEDDDALRHRFPDPDTPSIY